MKIYRVTLTPLRPDGTPYPDVRRKLFRTRIGAVASAAYWRHRGSDYNPPHRLYNVTVETAWVDEWQPYSTELERVENAVTKLATESAQAARDYLKRLLAVAEDRVMRERLVELSKRAADSDNG